MEDVYNLGYPDDWKTSSCKAEVVVNREGESSQEGEPEAELEDMQFHFPIHLGCTKMNWERKQTC